MKSKNNKYQPIDNLMVKSIDVIYKYGGFSIDVENYKYRLFIDQQGELILERYDKKAEVLITTANVERFLAILAYRTFFNKDKYIINIVPDRTKINKADRLKIANKMYNAYESILVDNPEKIRDVIATNDVSVFIEIVTNSEKDETFFDNIEDLLFNLEEMTYEYSEDLIYGLALYESLRIASPKDMEFIKKEWEEFVSHNKPNCQKKQVETEVEEREENKLNVPHEIINDRTFLVNPAIGRTKELRDIGASLLSYSVNPVLLGEPGVGKTAIIEGLAYKINNKEIANQLIDKKILKISPASIVSGCMYRGMFEERMQKLIEYLEQNPEYILYIDEIHTAYGTGSSSTSSNDMLNILKPYIENGTIKVIGATTSAEYEEIILNDKAFARRLRPITISEPNDEVLRQIIETNITKYENLSNIPFASSDDEQKLLIDVLIDVTNEKYRTYKERRYNPALVLSIIEQAFGYASFDEAEYVGRDYIIEALNLSECIYESCRQRAVETLKSALPKTKSYAKIIEFKPLKELD